MQSSATDSLDLPNLERDMPLGEADFDAMWRSRAEQPMTFQEYLDFLSSVWIPHDGEDAAPFIEPFTL